MVKFFLFLRILVLLFTDPVVEFSSGHSVLQNQIEEVYLILSR